MRFQGNREDFVDVGERIAGEAVDVFTEDDSVRGGGESEGELRGGEEIGGSV